MPSLSLPFDRELVVHCSFQTLTAQLVFFLVLSGIELALACSTSLSVFNAAKREEELAVAVCVAVVRPRWCSEGGAGRVETGVGPGTGSKLVKAGLTSSGRSKSSKLLCENGMNLVLHGERYRLLSPITVPVAMSLACI